VDHQQGGSQRRHEAECCSTARGTHRGGCRLNPAFDNVISASDADRRDLFLGTAARLGTAVQNVEKDFWVCWSLDALFNGLAPGGPRLLFKAAPRCPKRSAWSLGSRRTSTSPSFETTWGRLSMSSRSTP